LVTKLQSPKCIDLFCGAGGLSEGFRQAGFETLFANDIDANALETFALNHPKTPLIYHGAVEQIQPRKITRSLGLRKGELDVLVGGPPCQGFSINAPDRALDDPRNHLFRYYIQFVDALRPKAIVMENVPGLVSMGNWAFLQTISGALTKLGYEVEAKILYAAHYGVPQERWRLVIMGSRVGSVQFPSPTHFAPGRPNFAGGRTMTFRHALRSDSNGSELLPFTTVAEAISDLPRLEPGQGSENEPYLSSRKPPSTYARELRRGSKVVSNHVAPKIAKVNRERVKFVPPGGSWRDIPHELLPKGMQRARRSDHTKRYGRLAADGLSGTIMTKCDPHWGAVFLPDQDRTLSVREAARLQSFPDHYVFRGPRVSQYTQVGNAVPPLLAKAIGLQVLSLLRSSNQGSRRFRSIRDRRTAARKPVERKTQKAKA